MKKVSIICYACSPYQGSEAGVGWGILSNLAKEMELIAFVETEKFKPDLDKYLANFPNSAVAKNVEFIFIRKKRRRILRKIWPPSYYWYYKKWHKNVYNILRDKVRKGEISLIHQVTMVGFREPGYSWKLNVPFVIGPIGGLGFVRLRDFKYFDLYGKFYYFCFNVINFFHTFFSIRVYRAWKKANCGTVGILAADIINAKYIQKLTSNKPIIIPEVGPPYQFNKSSIKQKSNEKLRLIWVGNIENRKGLVILLQALKDLKRPYEMNIFGDGPLMNKMKNYSLSNCIDAQFHGQLSRECILKNMALSDLLVFTSLRDLSATVTIEANNCGLPVVCFNRGGFSKWLCPKSNFILDGNSNLVNLLYNFLENYDVQQGQLNDEIQINKLFNWENKVRVIQDIYIKKSN